ncbi:magnesium transporter [Mangrovimonas yunxiaonensis]|uniref:Magnesium transport protein CorA n=1 Tax=Mangrovimonas yunxiaonensis TaxID=1197477 RepID=A0A084TJE2_9FLAO|nr:magnesium/cobalt transporter CorA [Mangrovimonas yunxiaonensis]KFB00828.1 magnesium transporter [Mangrovimonas yunxiaonensis]GGH44187.1 magnesium and cobalt transport protein CorA [Mangrovimonas yunxiaonensis]
MAKKRTSKYKKHVGQVPGAIVYTGDKVSEKLFIESFDYNPQQVVEVELNNVEEAFKFKSSNTITWINLNGLNHIADIEKIGQHYDLHPLVLEDIVNTSQRPKIDEYDDYIFISLKMLYYNANEDISIEQVSLVMGSNYVLTFQEAEGDVFDTVRERIRNGKGRIRGLGSDYLLYALIDAIVDHYYIVSETLGNKIEDIEDVLFEGTTTDKMSQQVLNLKKELLKVRRAIFPLREIINRIEKSNTKFVHEKTLQFYSDIYDHIIQLSDTIDIYREMIWSLMDLYMTNISNRMNEVMKVLTIIATIFIPLTFIAGIYGMNFDHMPELHYKNAYYIVWGLMIVIFIGMLYYFRKKRWL